MGRVRHSRLPLDGHVADGGDGRCVTTADFNGDSIRDVASTGNSFRATVFLNDGAGRLTSIGDFGNGYTSTSIKAGDLDGDNDIDLAFANPGISQITVLLNAGDGTYPSHTFYAAGDNCNDVVSQRRPVARSRRRRS